MVRVQMIEYHIPKARKIRYCDNCGVEIRVGDRYCPYCGQQILIFTFPSANVGGGVPLDSDIRLALSFIDKLKTDSKGSAFWEVLDSGHGDHRVWPQSQFLLYLLSYKVGLHDSSYLAQAAKIVCNNDLTVCAVDRWGKAGDRFCVLLGDPDDFYLKDERVGTTKTCSDENSLLLLYRLLTNQLSDADNLFGNLENMWDYSVNLLGRDQADCGKYAIYKTALFGIAAKAIGNSKWVQIVQSRLRELQTRTGPCAGGWKTHLLPDKTFDGVENVETTALSVIALLPE